MDARPNDPLIHLVRAARAGEEGVQDRLVRALYGELRRVAGGRMRRERPGHTLQPSALVHEALLRLLRGDALTDPADRSHLLAAAARAMRQVLIDHARRRRARPEGRLARVPLDEAIAYFEDQQLDVVALHEALDRLACEHPRPARVVDLRFFGGLSIAEAAEALGVSDTTVEADWRFARAWLRDQLGGQDDDA
jgi:RNA polymerase sigma factor (TIGR02999 family)